MVTLYAEHSVFGATKLTSVRTFITWKRFEPLNPEV
jgi:hypothetical protein